jgi:hypothetical protein
MKVSSTGSPLTVATLLIGFFAPPVGVAAQSPCPFDLPPLPA